MRTVTSRTSTSILLVLILSLLTTACRATGNVPGIHLNLIELPPGFRIDLYARDVPNARSLVMSPNGVLFVGTRSAGNVYAILDKNQDQVADEVIKIAEGLNMPNGVAFRDGALFVAEVDRILRFDNIENNLQAPPRPAVVNDSFPQDQHHGWKYIAFGPDDNLYVPVGAPCNVCQKKDRRYASIMRIKPDGSNLEIYARGVRNTVGFDWHPLTGDLWFTNNGRDWMGDDLPPDTLHVAAVQGLNFGFPFCHGGDIPDPDYGKNIRCQDFAPPPPGNLAPT